MSSRLDVIMNKYIENAMHWDPRNKKQGKPSIKFNQKRLPKKVVTEVGTEMAVDENPPKTLEKTNLVNNYFKKH